MKSVPIQKMAISNQIKICSEQNYFVQQTIQKHIEPFYLLLQIYNLTSISFCNPEFMSKSVASKASNASSKMLEELASRSQSKILRAQGVFNDQEMRLIWNSLGLYINRNLRMGRGVNVPKLGIFTLTPPQVVLKGVTNQSDRDKKPRAPVFLIQKDFVKGMNFKTAIFYHQEFGMGLRPYSAFGQNGDVPITKMNIVEISSYANMTKDATQIALNRLIKYLGEKLQQGQNLSFEIPSVGTLISKGNLVAVKFNEQLHRDTRTILSKSVDQRKQRGVMNLTSDNLKKLSSLSELSAKLQNKSKDFFDIDETALNYLQNEMGVSVSNPSMRRTSTGFNRSFLNTKTSDVMRMSSTGFTTGKIKNFNREYNYALKIVKQWVYKNSLSTEQSFKDFCALSGSNKSVLKEEDVWTTCKRIASDINQQQSQQLFRLLDFNKDGYVTEDDWKRNINFDSNKLLRDFVNQIKRKNYKMSEVLKIMKLEGVKSVGIHNLKQSLRRISSDLSEDDALFLSRYICKGKAEVPIEIVVDILNISSIENEKVTVDQEWQEKFVGRIKKKMIDNEIFEDELLNRFGFYDNKGTGFIDQTEFKNVLAEIGVSLTLNELIKIVRIFPINAQNQINYQQFVQRLNFCDPVETHASLSAKTFQNTFFQLIKGGKPSFKLPISVIELTSHLQSRSLKEYPEIVILPHVQRVDVNRDGYISQQDIKAFESQTQSKEIPQMDDVSINNLFTRLRQRSIKKKISYFDVFRTIDVHNNGFITREQWHNNLNKILQFTEVEKQNMFNFMNKVKNLQMVDYKTFLSFINNEKSAKVDVYEKFDWVEDVLQKIKEWYANSKLTLDDSFKVVDKDGDTYLNEKDLINFLADHIKISAKQASIVRIQKLIKVLDTFKKGKLNFLDWKNFIQREKTDWIQDAKQQISLVISRMYSDLEDAYTNITQGDRKLLFTTFEKWIKANKVLSGFMINEDILKSLFSSLDEHKKGYLLENDFVSAFGKYDWKIEHIKEYIEELKHKFNSAQQAFKCLVSYKNTDTLSEDKFYESSKNILGSRFSKSDLKNIWASISSGKSSVSFSDFDRKYGCEWKNQQNAIEKTFPKDSWLYRDFPIIKGTQTRGPEYEYSQVEKMEIQSRQIIENLKDMLTTSPKTLQQAFIEVDSEKKGRITNLQFKKAFRVLNIALTAKQIDLLLNYCNFHVQSLIDWKEFLRKMNIREEKKSIVDRLHPKIQHLSDLLHYYMVSPKDAYRKWNNPRTGYMSFEEFYKMLEKLYEQASEPFPQFQLLKELFAYIDVRKDNQLDFQEFTQIFRNCTPPSLLMGTKPADEQQMMAKIMKNKQDGMPVRQQTVPLFKHSPVYEEFINLMGRNRKFIQTEIQKESKESLVAFSVVQKIITGFAEKQKFKLEDNLIRNLLAFSMTGQKVDYRLMLNDFKTRSEQIVEHPKRNFF